jgi:DNA-binding transcriptional regulator GbsR (MarR family)
MKQGGVGCIDCHVNADLLIKPDNKICLKCHEKGYEQQMEDWKKDVKTLLSETNSLLNELKGAGLNTDLQNEVNEIRKNVNQINSYPSIYVHNYDLLSTYLAEKKKKLQSFR